MLRPREKPARSLILMLSLLCMCLFLVSKASADDGTPMSEYRNNTKLKHGGCFQAEVGAPLQIYDESLYARANESVRVFRPEKIAIIGRSRLDYLP